jgi:hypothetical protein
MKFLDHAPENSKCVDLDYKYTDAVKNVKQKNLLLKKRQRAAIPQLNPTYNYPQGIYALANAYIETNLSKTDLEIAAIRREG